MVVDTGLHHKRWSRERGQQFFVERNGSKLEEVKSEVDRYCSWPGQACGYQVGQSEIPRHSARAQYALGDRKSVVSGTSVSVSVDRGGHRIITNKININHTYETT